jgi:fumarate hydratase class II
MNKRQESDSLGVVDVPADKLWGAQTQRALENFQIGWQTFPKPFIHHYALIKKASALSNLKLGKLEKERSDLIVQTCDEIIAAKHDSEFPLPVWQTGSGTQCNMNLNEVIANRANELSGGKRGDKSPVHPNDHVNLSQSSNDTFPTAMHISAVLALQEQLFPALENLLTELEKKQQQFSKRLKSGRTHLMDATPLTLGQEFGAYHAQIKYGFNQLKAILPSLQELAIGGSAVGTGLNTHPQWSETVVSEIATLTGVAFTPAPNKFAALAGHEALKDCHGRLATLATSLLKIANDLRLMASGPRCGLNEIQLPANEPGSSIMPGKVNPTQIEALTMVCARVMGNDTTITVANSQGQFQLNVFKPVIIYTLLESISLLSDVMNSFCDHCLQGIEANDFTLDHYINNSLMLVTALNPHIGYDNAAKAAKYAFENKCSLEKAVVDLNLLSAEDYQRLVIPENMLAPQ